MSLYVNDIHKRLQESFDAVEEKRLLRASPYETRQIPFLAEFMCRELEALQKRIAELESR